MTPQLVQQINKIEQDLNSLKTVFKNWTPVSQDGGAALKAAATSWAAQQLQKTQNTDIANDKITQ
jgi:hypothetical protein